MFYLVCNSSGQRDGLIEYLKKNGVHAVFHYLSLHKSDYYKKKYTADDLPNADHYSSCLIRIPFFYELNEDDVNKIYLTIINANKSLIKF